MSYHKLQLPNYKYEETEAISSHIGAYYPNNSNFEQTDIKIDQYRANIGEPLVKWCEKLGYGRKKTLKYLKDMINQGKGRVIKVPIIDITGRLNYSYYYVLEMEQDGNKE